MSSINEDEFQKRLSFLDAELETLCAIRIIPPRTRSTSWWIADILHLLHLPVSKGHGSPQYDKMLFKLMTLYPLLYESSDFPDNVCLEGITNYYELISARDYFANLCHTLIQVECQQEAKERAGRSDSRGTRVSTEDGPSEFSQSYWKRPLDQDDSYFSDISKYAIDFKERTKKFYGDSFVKHSEKEWDEKIKKVFEKITYYPVTSMLMPVLLTKCIVDDTDYDSVYASMKYRDKSFPRNRSADQVRVCVQELYDKVAKRTDQLNVEWMGPVNQWWMSTIKDATNTVPRPDSKGQQQIDEIKARAEAAKKISVEDIFTALDDNYKKYQRTAFQRGLPIISLSDILDVLQDKFKKARYDFNKRELWEQLAGYMRQNGLSFTSAKESTNFSDKDRILISVAQLCNATSYLNFRCGHIQSQAVCEALDYLAGKEIICDLNNTAGKDERYFFLYREFCDTFKIREDDLSPLAICKYFRLNSWTSLQQINFFNQLYSLMVGCLISIKSEILSQFDLDPILEVEAYNEVFKLFDRVKEELLPKGDISKLDNLEKFVNNPQNFTSSGYKKFLESTLGIKNNPKIPNCWKIGTIYELFSLTLDFISSTLLDYMRQYCIVQLQWYTDKNGK